MADCRLCEEVVHGAVRSGGSSAEILLIGQAPGITEVDARRPFNHTAGKRLFQWLETAGFDEATFRREQAITSVTKCYPGRHKSGRGDRVPTKEEILLCHPFLRREIDLIQPRAIILVGGLAIRQFFPAKTKLSDIIGTALVFRTLPDDPFDITNAKHLTHLTSGFKRAIIPLPHPSGASAWIYQDGHDQLLSNAISILADLKTLLA